MKKKSIKTLRLNKKSISYLDIRGGGPTSNIMHNTDHIGSCEGTCASGECATALGTVCNNTQTICGAYCTVSSG
ncbi:hypothetical protein [Ascidiimonas sp. W6]|uniref:hypothetical protein n=1 Tax=Ascidiimonas meishanensis TaxID=3128903 RepID=UPI0030EC8E82